MTELEIKTEMTINSHILKGNHLLRSLIFLCLVIRFLEAGVIFIRITLQYSVPDCSENVTVYSQPVQQDFWRVGTSVTEELINK